MMTVAQWKLRRIAVGAFVMLFSTVAASDLLLGVACAASEKARGPVSTFTGNRSDLVLIRLHIAGGLNVMGTIFDSGSIVMSNTPPKGPKLCGDTAAHCVFAPSNWVIGKHLASGNEVGDGSLFFPQDLYWERLPGPLVITFIGRGNIFLGVNSGVARSDEITASAGQDIFFDLAAEKLSGGIGITITHSRSVNLPVLFLAARGCQKDVVEVLVARGADVNANKDDTGRTPLHEAARFGCVPVAEVLLARGANVNASDSNGNTPLHQAVFTDQQGMAEMLLAHGAVVNAKNRLGHTPLYFAGRNIRTLLREHGGYKH
jgi:hypothetical protein